MVGMVLSRPDKSAPNFPSLGCPVPRVSSGPEQLRVSSNRLAGIVVSGTGEHVYRVDVPYQYYSQRISVYDAKDGSSISEPAKGLSLTLYRENNDRLRLPVFHIAVGGRFFDFCKSQESEGTIMNMIRYRMT